MFQFRYFGLKLLCHHTDILQAGKICAQQYLQLVAEAVVAVADGTNAPHKDPGREDAAETAGLYNVAHLEACVAGNVVEYGV